MSAKPSKGDYAVGYRKPPEHTRFAPGTSGNPRGRRKDEPSARQKIKRELGWKPEFSMDDTIKAQCESF